MDPRLAAIRKHSGSNERRYWPPGQHPATARLRANLKKAYELERKAGFTGGLTEYIDYLKEQIAAFEEVESELKAHMYWYITRDKKGRR